MDSKLEKLGLIVTSKCLMDTLKMIVIEDDDTKQLQFKLISALMNGMDRVDKRSGRIWMYARSGVYWERDVASYNNSQWIENFRMAKETFYSLVDLIYLDMKPDDLAIREPIPAAKRTAIALYMLASSAEYRTVAHAFGVSKASVCNCLKRFCMAINKRLDMFITWPNEEDSINIAERILRKHKFPQVIGCVDGSHIPIMAPSEGKKDWTNRKGWDSIILQAVVDDCYMFRDIYVEWPGSTHDATVFKSSGLFKYIDQLPQAPITLNGVEVPHLILGDPAYPLLKWLIKPYVGHGLSPQEESFNAYHSSVRIYVENAFGRLKARWRILAKKLTVAIDMVPYVVATCCAINNMCERTNTAIPDHDHQVVHFPQPPTNPLPQHDYNDLREEEKVRRAIVNHLATTQPLRQSFR